MEGEVLLEECHRLLNASWMGSPVSREEFQTAAAAALPQLNPPSDGFGGPSAAAVGMGMGSSDPELEGRLVEAAVALGRGWKPQPNLYRWELGSYRSHCWELSHRREGWGFHPLPEKAPSEPTTEFPPPPTTGGNFCGDPTQTLPTLDAHQWELLSYLTPESAAAVAAAAAVGTLTVQMLRVEPDQPVQIQAHIQQAAQQTVVRTSVAGDELLWRIHENSFETERRLKLIREERKQLSKGRHPLQRMDRELQQELWVLKKRSQGVLQHLLVESALIWDCDERLELQSSTRGELLVLQRYISKIQ